MLTRTRKILALAALAAVVVVTGVDGGPAKADAPVFTLPGLASDAGVLRLRLGAQDHLRLEPVAGSPLTPATESISVSGCNFTSPSRLAMTPLAPGAQQIKLGLTSDGIGVQVKGEGNGGPCGLVNGPSQSLDLALAGALASYEMDYAELDIEGKFGVTVKAQLYLDNTLVHTELLATGGPDSGADSGDRDNFRWRLPAESAGLVVFDRIVLSVNSSTPGGAFSLEGGADGTTPHPGGLGDDLDTTDSLFHLTNIDGILGCGGSATENGTGGAPSVTVTLVNQAGCAPVPYALSVSNVDGLQAIAFEKIGGTSNVYRTTVTWPIEATAYPVPPTQIRYSNSDPPHDLEWCSGTPASPAKPSPTEHWCLLDHQAHYTGDDTMQVVEELWGQSDPGAWR